MTHQQMGEWEQLVMLAILHLGEGAYGVAIAREIEHRSGRAASRTALYVTFDRLEKKGLLESRLEKSEGRRTRRFVDVTSKGLSALAESRRRMTDMWKGLEGLLDERAGE